MIKLYRFFRLIKIIIKKHFFKMASSPYNNSTFDRKVHSCCASTSYFTVTPPLTAHGHSPQHHRRAQTVYESRWRLRVSPSTSRSSVLNPRSTFTEYHRERPTALSGEGERGRPDAGAASAVQPGRPPHRAPPLVTQPPVRWTQFSFGCMFFLCNNKVITENT